MKLDGPHRVFVVLAGLWAACAVLFVGQAARRRFVYGLVPIPWGLDWPPHALAHPWLETAILALVPIAFLYGFGWAGRKVVGWIAAGFDQRANSGLVDPGRHQ